MSEKNKPVWITIRRSKGDAIVALSNKDVHIAVADIVGREAFDIMSKQEVREFCLSELAQAVRP